MILVTGATGNNGLEILKRLASQNVQARAMVRDRNRAKAITDLGFEMVEADFDRPETLPSALAGVDRAFLVTNSTEHAETQQLAFVEAAKQSGVKHIVKLSQFAANADSPVRFFCATMRLSNRRSEQPRWRIRFCAPICLCRAC